MLRSLSIKNYAIIDQLMIDFHDGLNVITGETGAGKSIIIGALNMILGKRADSSALRDDTSKSIIEGTFHIKHLALQTFFEDNDLDYEDESIIRREIKPNGKSRAFINDSPVTLDKLKGLTEKLVDLHAQHETQALLDKTFFIRVLDHLAEQNDVVQDFSSKFKSCREKKKQLTQLMNKINDQKNDLDYLEFQLNELEELSPAKEDGEALENELNILEHAESIQNNLQTGLSLMEGNDLSILELWGELSNKIYSIAQFGGDLEKLQSRIESISIELNDITVEINQIIDSTNVDEERLSNLQLRQNQVNRLLQKHHLNEISELIQLHKDLKQKLQQLEVSDENVEQLKIEIQEMENELISEAKEISAERLRYTGQLTSSITAILSNIGMPHAQVELCHTELDIDQFNGFGMDTFELLFSANKGVKTSPLKNVASGGERSRLMLAIKSIVAGHVELPTMIFDEIDTGISGEVAGKVGDVFKKLAKKHQVISISHLPQIAARANQHLFVYKDHTKAITNTQVRVLNNDERIIEIAKMLSGEKPGEAAVNAAKELIA